MPLICNYSNNCEYELPSILEECGFININPLFFWLQKTATQNCNKLVGGGGRGYTCNILLPYILDNNKIPSLLTTNKPHYLPSFHIQKGNSLR